MENQPEKGQLARKKKDQQRGNGGGGRGLGRTMQQTSRRKIPDKKG